jgi:hypothetical protein
VRLPYAEGIRGWRAQVDQGKALKTVPALTLKEGKTLDRRE